MCKVNYKYVKAPKEWEGKTYKKGFIYEHHYVYWKNTGEYLTEDEIIHHKNGDKHDNRFENLEKMTRSDHSRNHSRTGKTMVKLKCPICGNIFEREKRQTHLVKKTNVTCCSRSCSASLSSFVRKGGDLESLVEGNVIEIYKEEL